MPKHSKVVYEPDGEISDGSSSRNLDPKVEIVTVDTETFYRFSVFEPNAPEKRYLLASGKGGLRAIRDLHKFLGYVLDDIDTPVSAEEPRHGKGCQCPDCIADLH